MICVTSFEYSASELFDTLREARDNLLLHVRNGITRLRFVTGDSAFSFVYYPTDGSSDISPVRAGLSIRSTGN
jgi:hypothetical protein